MKTIGWILFIFVSILLASCGLGPLIFFWALVYTIAVLKGK